MEYYLEFFLRRRSNRKHFPPQQRKLWPSEDSHRCLEHSISNPNGRPSERGSPASPLIPSDFRITVLGFSPSHLLTFEQGIGNPPHVSQAHPTHTISNHSFLLLMASFASPVACTFSGTHNYCTSLSFLEGVGHFAITCAAEARFLPPQKLINLPISNLRFSHARSTVPTTL